MADKFGPFEKKLASRVVLDRSLTVGDWKSYSGLVTPGDLMISRLRPQLESGAIREAEFAWLHTALTGGKGDAEKGRARQLVEERSLTPDDWRRVTELYNPAGVVVDAPLRNVAQLLSSGGISQDEAQWLREALGAKRGEEEQALAKNFVERKTIGVDQWRAQTRRNRPSEPAAVDPIAEKIAPLLAARTITRAEGDWLHASLAGEKDDEEKSLAADFVEAKTRTVGQWRAKTKLAYPLKDTATITPDQLPPVIDLFLSATTHVRLLLIPAGEYLRGSSSGAQKEIGRLGLGVEPEPTLTKISTAFYIGRFEVTQMQFASVMPRDRIQSVWRYYIPNSKGGANWPIDSINWDTLMGKSGFIALLNRTLAGKFGGALVADLPTEEEWEYACRADTKTAFNSGKNITNAANDPALDALATYNKTINGHPDDVGTHEPNAWGLYDMHGNVSEWCSDGYVRGGSWASSAANCRAAWRAQVGESASASNQWGFRLVLRYKKTGN